MAAKKTAKGSPMPAPRVVSVFGEPSGAFARVLDKTRAAGLDIKPFEITDGLMVYPLTPNRRKKMDEAQAAMLLAQTAAVELLRNPGVAPDDPDERKVWIEKLQQEQADITAQVEASLTAYNEALFGGAEIYERVNEFFADRDEWEKEAFQNAIQEQFFRLPHDGKCQVCGSVVDPKALTSTNGSSGSSNDISPNSTGTSPDTSEEPIAVTGGGAADLGTSF